MTLAARVRREATQARRRLAARAKDKTGRPGPALMMLGALLLQSAPLFAQAPGSNAATIAGSLPANPPTPLEQRLEQDGVEVILRANRHEMAWSDLLQLSLSASAIPPRVVTMPKVGDLLGDFRVRKRLPVNPDFKAQGPRTWRREYVLEPARPGELEIPALEVVAEDESVVPNMSCRYLKQCNKRSRPALETVALATRAHTIVVKSLLADDADVYAPHEIAPPRSLPGAGPGAVEWLAAAAAAALALFALARVWRKRPGAGRASVATGDGDNPGEQTLLALGELERLQGAGAGNDDALYERLSEVVRGFIGWRFEFPTREQTTEETLGMLKRSRAAAGMRDAIGEGPSLERARDVLRACDRVKFARRVPPPVETVRALERAREFVNAALAGGVEPRT